MSPKTGFSQAGVILILFMTCMFFGVSTSLGLAGRAAHKVRIYLDADMTGTRASGVSIEQGIRTALFRVGNKLAGRDVELVILDHRGNTRRSKEHLERYLADDQALVVFAGLHSPPLLSNLDFINENAILVMVPWAAAGGITRYPSGSNWIFRLSVDDTKAGYVIVEYALDTHYFRKPVLLLEETGWGKSNEATMKKALKDAGFSAPTVTWFNWNLQEHGARIILRDLIDQGADAVFLVANAPEGEAIIRAMAALPAVERLPVFSHWGITGGNFFSAVGPAALKSIDLHFIQTRFSFLDDPQKEPGKTVFETAKTVFPVDIRDRKDIQAPTGFIHAYDLTNILIAAVNQCGLTGRIEEDRENLRLALENINTPVPGLIKTYIQPFGVFKADSPDAHEALNIDDLVMARYGPDGEIILEQ
jgi:branched-chain amino acid transport system substrate-binding protein